MCEDSCDGPQCPKTLAQQVLVSGLRDHVDVAQGLVRECCESAVRLAYSVVHARSLSAVWCAGNRLLRQHLTCVMVLILAAIVPYNTVHGVQLCRHGSQEALCLVYIETT